MGSSDLGQCGCAATVCPAGTITSVVLATIVIFVPRQTERHVLWSLLSSNSSSAPFPLFTSRHLSACTGTIGEIAVTDTTVEIAVTDSTDRSPRRIQLGADHRRRRRQSVFKPNFGRSRSSSLPPTIPTRSPSLWIVGPFGPSIKL